MQDLDATESGNEIRRFIASDRVKDRLIDRVSFASDAGFYRLIPEAVVMPQQEDEIKKLLAWCRERKMPLVFRAGGSSLSGQSISDGILCDLSRYWKNCLPEENGKQVRVQPGITGSMVNARLKPFRRKIGPDPSSISAAMMGGILSNNASGMCCGVQHNSYHTTRFIRFILPDGNSYSTENQADYERFLKESAQLASTLESLRNQIAGNQELSARIRKRYQTKNTVGYSLNAFVDFEHPLDIFAHLLIGAEGTLAFIAEAVMETIPEHPFKATGLLFFSDVQKACASVEVLNNAGARMVELMDRASLRAVENKAGMPGEMKTLRPEATALLVEFQSDSESELEDCLQRFRENTGSLSLLREARFTRDAHEREHLWKVRKGLFPAVGAIRQRGTSVILEDLAFPLEKLGDAVTELRRLFEEFGYEDAIVFGHARDGNLHFVISQSFEAKEEVQRYEKFMNALVAMVLDFGGSLKAEHGTGRNMAPFVETEWGPEAYAIMKELKAAADPLNILNPGVILNANPKAHLENLKPLPPVEEEVDRCIECGFCEPVCPSRELSSSPRRRIVIRRAIREMEQNGELASMELLQRHQEYEVMETCAVDGLCATACPVEINTGDLVKRLRRENHSPAGGKIAMELARNFALAEWAAGIFLHAGRMGGKLSRQLSEGLRKISPVFPLWPGYVPAKPWKRAVQAVVENPEYLYFPSCINRNMGGQANGNVMDSFLSLCRRAELSVLEMPAAGLCCSQIFSSKGYSEAWQFMAQKVTAALWKASLEGKIPVVCDVSSCTNTFLHLAPALSPVWKARYEKLKFVDMVELLHDRILPILPEVEKRESLMMHPVCSLHKMGSTEKLLAIGRHFAHSVEQPLEGGCCGMAGDRGFFFPELGAAAASASCTSALGDGKIFSCTATCEMALRENLKRETGSVLELLEEAFEK